MVPELKRYVRNSETSCDKLKQQRRRTDTLRETFDDGQIFFSQYNFIEHTHVQLTFTKNNLQQNENYNLKLTKK